MSNNEIVKTAVAAFFDAYKADPRMSDSDIPVQERIALMDDVAAGIAKKYDIAKKELTDNMLRPITTVQSMMEIIQFDPSSKDAIVKLSKPHADKGVLLEFITLNKTEETVELSETFWQIARDILPKSSSPFHQSGVTPHGEPSDYHAFEFWNFDKCPQEVMKQAKHLAHEELGLQIEIAPELAVNM